MQSIDALKTAIQVLSKQNAASFLQTTKRHTIRLAPSENTIRLAPSENTNRRQMDKRTSLLTHHERKLVTAFIQEGDSYAPQSGEIFGILNQMKESFKQNLAETQKDEAANVQASP